jgi:signal transduction histidine kinase/CheY-like chemotaxis protein
MSPTEGSQNPVTHGDPIEARLNAKIFNLFALHKAVQVLSSVFDYTSLTHLAVDVEIEMAGAMSGALYIADGPGEPFRLAAAKSARDDHFASSVETTDPVARAAEGEKRRSFPATMAGMEEPGLVVPVRVRELLIGFFVLRDPVKEQPWSEDDREVLETLAAQVAVCVQNARLYRRVTEQNDELERRVAERTAELKAANDRLEVEVGDRRRAETAAAAANASKTEFLSRMSHELRTPLNAILGFSQLLQMGSLTPRQGDCVAHIVKGGQHLLELINEVLDISGIEAGRVGVSLRTLPVAAAVNGAMELVSACAAQREVELHRIASGEELVMADPGRLRQVLLNLLSNAIKYNRAGGRVTLSWEKAPPDRIRILVRDTGPGIPPDKLTRLFTPFDRLGAEQTSVEGTGLGLALSKRLVEAMRGTIRVASTVGAGTTFVVELLRAERLAEAGERTAPLAAAPTGAPPARGTLLYIEDTPSNLRLFEEILLHRPGLAMMSAMRGSLGLELARQHRPDVIVLDLHLPDLDGAEVLRRLRTDPLTRAIPVIVLTADATPARRQQLPDVWAYLTKPVDVTTVLTTLDEALSRAGHGAP